jgi:ribosome-binding factor A
MTQRTDRIDELLRQEIGALLAKEVADPRIGFATITDVETSPDLRHAKVWVSVIGQQAERAQTLAALQHAMVFVRRELGHRLRLRRIPEFDVRLDDTAERGTRVLKLITELEAGREPDTTPVAGESLPTPVQRLPHTGDAPDDQPAAAPPTRRRPRQARPAPDVASRRRLGGGHRRSR